MILAILGAIITILILLRRLAEAGIDLGGLNPFLWQRRRNWKKKFEGNPIYRIDSPMEITALLVTATAKSDGDMSSNAKQFILSLFHNEFHVSKREAANLLISSSYLLGNGEELHENLAEVLKPSLEKFVEEQAQSALNLLDKVCEIEPSQNELKREFVEQIKQIFQDRFKPQGKWQ